MSNNTVCPQCAAAISPEMVFCAACGTKLPKTAQPAHIFCPQCGTAATEEMDFCPACGTKLPKTAAPSKLFCPKCGKPGTTEMAFCAACGTELSSGTSKSSLNAQNSPNDLQSASRLNATNRIQPQYNTVEVSQAKNHDQLGMFAKIPSSSFSALNYNVSLWYFTQEAELKKLLDSKRQIGG